MIAPKTLQLVANPWAATDAEGRPCGACRRDPVEDNPDLGFVGAVLEVKLLKPQESRRVGKREQIVTAARHDRTFKFSADPVRVPNTAYYRDRAGRMPYELFPGDARTAEYLGYKDFVSAAKLIEAAKQKAIADFDAINGAGAWLEYNDERSEDAPVEPTKTVPTKGGK